MVVLILIALCLFFFINWKTPSLTVQSKGKKQYKEWLTSPHAMSMDNPEEKVRMNKTGCAHCHTAEGYWQVILSEKKSSAPYENAKGLTCIACHLQGKDSNSVGKLRTKNVINACDGCHSLLVQNTAHELEWCPQDSILEGIGGAEFEGKDYTSGAHATLDKNCVTCHMAETPAGKNKAQVGGHTFRVMTKGEAPTKFNKNSCIQCHENISLEWVRKKQQGFKKSLDKLAGLLPKKGTEGTQESEPKFPEDPSLNKTEKMASHNYWMILKDGTLGVHNPVYLKNLLEDSIESLEK
jgi:hypothetical protein